MNTHYRHKCCGLQSPISLIGNLWSAQPGLERLKPQRQEGESEGTGVREKEIDEEKESNKNIQESCSIIGTVCQSPILCAWVGQGSHLVPTETQHLQEQFLVPPTSQQRRADSSTLCSSLQDYCVCVSSHLCLTLPGALFQRGCCFETSGVCEVCFWRSLKKIFLFPQIDITGKSKVYH